MWLWIIFWILFAIIITGAIIFAVGYAAPHKNKPDNTVNYETLKWVGVSLLIFGGVGMIFWIYFKFRKPKVVETNTTQPFITRTMSGGNSRYSSFNGDMNYGFGQMSQEQIASNIAGLEATLRQREALGIYD